MKRVSAYNRWKTRLSTGHHHHHRSINHQHDWTTLACIWLSCPVATPNANTNDSSGLAWTDWAQTAHTAHTVPLKTLEKRLNERVPAKLRLWWRRRWRRRSRLTNYLSINHSLAAQKSAREEEVEVYIHRQLLPTYYKPPQSRLYL